MLRDKEMHEHYADLLKKIWNFDYCIKDMHKEGMVEEENVRQEVEIEGLNYSIMLRIDTVYYIVSVCGCQIHSILP